MSIEAKLSARETPAGRRYEAKIISYDCLVLVLGCVGLAVSFPPLIYAAAVAHLVASFLMTPVKWFWPIVQAAMLAIVATLLLAATYIVRTYYHRLPLEEVFNWPLLVATSVVTAGIVGTLFSYPGCIDQLREHLDRADTKMSI